MTRRKGIPTSFKGMLFRSRQEARCGCATATRLSYPKGEASLNSLLASYKLKARKRGHPFELDLDLFKKLTQDICYYCGKEPKQTYGKKARGLYTYNGIDRIDNTLGYIIGNVRSCCKFCNQAKSNHSEDFFFTSVKRIVARHP